MLLHVHPRSYIVGVLSGVLLLLVFSGTRSLFFPVSQSVSPPYPRDAGARNGAWFQRGGAISSDAMAGQSRLQRAAEQFGMTTEELQAELDAGKTLRQVAEERGAERARMGTGAMQLPDSSSGAATGSTKQAETSR